MKHSENKRSKFENYKFAGKTLNPTDFSITYIDNHVVDLVLIRSKWYTVVRQRASAIVA